MTLNLNIFHKIDSNKQKVYPYSNKKVKHWETIIRDSLLGGTIVRNVRLDRNDPTFYAGVYYISYYDFNQIF